MTLSIGRLRIYLGYELAAALAAALLLDMDNRLIVCMAAAALHELGHLLMMRAFGVRVSGVSFRLTDVLIRAESPPTAMADFLITLAGPGTNLILAGLTIPFGGFFGTANLAVGVFNLLPVISLDGGRLLTIALERRLSAGACRVILYITSFLFILPIMTAGIFVLLRSGYNYSLLGISL